MKNRAENDHLTLGMGQRSAEDRPATDGRRVGKVQGRQGALAAAAVMVRCACVCSPFSPTYTCFRLLVTERFMASALRRKVTTPIGDMNIAGIKLNAKNYAARDYHKAFDRFLPSILALKTIQSPEKPVHNASIRRKAA